MKFKKIMLVAFVLLAILTIGAASAADDVASDDLAVGDDGDLIESPVDDADSLSEDGDEELEDVNFWVNDEDEFGEDDFDDAFCGAIIKKGAEGNISVSSEDKVFFNKALSDFGDNVEEYDEDFNEYFISINDVKRFEGLEGDTLKLSFSEDSRYDLTFIVDYDDEFECYTFEYDEDEYEGILYIDEENIIAPGDREVIGLDTGMEMDSGRIVVFDIDTGAIYFNNTLSNMTYNTDWMRYKFNSYDGYYIFAEDLNVPSSGEYDINVTYYNDDNTINETLTGTVMIDLDAFINEDEVDISDDSTPLIGTYIFDWFDDGAIVVGYYDEREDICPLIKRDITASDIGTVINFTNKELKLDVGVYGQVYIGYLEDGYDEDDEDAIEFIIAERDISIVDNSKFRMRINDEASIFTDGDLLKVYCPADFANTNITIKVNGDPVITHLIDESECGDYISFNFTELQIDDVGKYSFDLVNDSGENLTETEEYELANPFEFPKYCVNGTDDDFIVELIVPEGYNEGTISVYNEENLLIFDGDLADMEPESLGWEDYERYQVLLENLTYYSTGLNTFRAVYVGNGFNIENSGQVSIYERKYVKNDNVTIDIIDYLIYCIGDIYNDEADPMVIVSADNNKGYVVVKLGEWNITIHKAYDDDGEYIYEISIHDFEEFEEDMTEGKYPITVSYFDADGIEVLNLTSKVTLVEGEVDGEIRTFDVVMGDGWKDQIFVDLRVLKNFDGVVVIVLDNDVFKVDLSQVELVEDEKMPDVFVHYLIAFNNLDKEIYEAGEYSFYIEVFDDEEDDNHVWDYGKDFIRFYEPQIAENENVTIEIEPSPVIIPNGAFIYISAVDASGNVTIYVDGWDEPVNISLSECLIDEKNRYIIGTDKLELDVGEYTLNVTYQGISYNNGNIILVSNVDMYTPDEDETQYWGYGLDPIIAIISLRDGDMENNPPEGKIVIYIEGETDPCFVGNVRDIDWMFNMQGRVIRLSHLEGCSNLTGKYKFEIKYVNGSEAETGYETELTLKEIEADDFAVSIDGDRIVLLDIPTMWGVFDVTVDGKTETYDFWYLDVDDDDNPYIRLSVLNKGAHKVTVSYRNDDSESLELLSTVVNPIDPQLTISVTNVTEGENPVITITTVEDFNGEVMVQIGSKNYTVIVINGQGSEVVRDISVPRTYVAEAVFEAVDLFNCSTKNTTFTITAKALPADPNLTISIADITVGASAVVKITTNNTFSGTVKVQIGNNNYTVDVVNGTGSVSVSGLAVGNYTAVATFEATDVFNASTKNATFKVNKEVIPDSDTAISTDSSSSSPYPVYSINLGPDATGTFTVEIGGKKYTAELKDGAATIEVTDLPAGAYDAVISYSGDDKYAPISKTVNSTVKTNTTIKASAVTTTYGTSKNIVITLTDANGKALAGKEVTVVLNGVTKKLTTDAKGQVSYAIGTKLAVKKYDATFTFDGDANYVKSTGTAKVTVNKAKPKLTAKKKTFKAKKKTKKYTVTLKTNKGKAMKKAKVTLTGKFKGKKIKITKKTNSKGKATFNLKKLTKKGKFTAKIKFKGNKSYKAVTKKAKITVKK